ncbi:MAG: hypothetical protein AB1567_12360 [bacterium]
MIFKLILNFWIEIFKFWIKIFRFIIRRGDKMPYRIGKKIKKGYPIINKDRNEIVGYSKTKEKAKASIRARLGSEHGWKPRRRKK